MLALSRRSAPIEAAAYFLFVISAAGAIVAYLTGEGAEEAVEHIGGISKTAIEAHEHFAIYPLFALILLGILSIAGIILIQKKSGLARKIPLILIIIAVISFMLVAWTAYLGGQIRHTELKKDQPAQNQSYRDQNLRKLP
jgi:uncharacterized membrane protein